MTTANTNGTSLMVQGRILWVAGDLFTGKKKTDMQTKQVILDQSGQPVIEYGFGLAVPKVNPANPGQFTPAFLELWNIMQREAQTLYPNGQIPPTFAMKYKDGDTDVDESGVPYNKREGYAGHIVLACTTRIPVKFFIYQGGNNILVNTGFKCGDYVNAQLNIKAHPAVGRGKAGLYMNPSAVQFVAAGQEIINTPSGDQMFGVAAPAYAGQVIAPTNAPMPNMGGAPTGGMPQQGYNQAPPQNTGYNNAPPQHNGGMPQQGYNQAPPQNTGYNNPPAPHYDVLPPNMQPNGGGMPQQGYNQAPPQNTGYNNAPPQHNGGMPSMPR